MNRKKNIYKWVAKNRELFNKICKKIPEGIGCTSGKQKYFVKF